ncbi:ATP synthase F1, delta subunit [Ammonifex degensii KC4]|uniref:ATP synthase subunit delta n=1 Tax=Ammonifex degensii (strain DSM 10501 / KC4) TaxID=429009 RepID=C9RAE7_AMMDK|nr:ATP synthase F1 subunit delta [Ammonifex degensii]ACX51256.1 ATP synthase F1, delta subunit [Ammonifex degensii KC4]
MLKGAVAQRYAEALFGLAQEKGLLDKIEEDLRAVEEALATSSDLRRVFYHPQVPAEVKKAIVKELWEKDLHPYTLNFLNVVLDARREIFFKDIVAEYRRLLNETKNLVEVEVTSAIELSPEQASALTEALKEAVKREVTVRYRVNPDILGGLVVRIGNRVIDASVARQLERLREQIREIRVS